MKIEVHIVAARFQVYEPDAPEYAEEYSDDHWHPKEWAHCFRVRMISQGKCCTFEGPSDLTHESLVKTLEHAAKEMALFYEKNSDDIEIARKLYEDDKKEQCSS